MFYKFKNHIIDNTQRAYIESFDRVEQFNTENATVLSSIPEYQAEIAAFTAGKLLLKNAVGQQHIDTSHIKSSKDLKKQEMADLLVRYEFRARVKASQAGNTHLETLLKHPITYFTKSDDVLAATHAKNLVQVLADNLTTLTNITTADINAMSEAIVAFESDSSKPVMAKEQKKLSGTDIIKTQIPIINKHVDYMLMLLISYLNTDNPAVVAHFKSISQLIHTGVKHNHALFHVVDNASLAAIAHATISGDGKTETSDENGNADLEKAHTGLQHFAVQAAPVMNRRS